MNAHLQTARQRKDDEFYTPYSEVDRVVNQFKAYFRNKIVYCNCDDERSSFYKFFKDNFDSFHLKKLYVSGIHIPYVIEYDGVKEVKNPVYDGDYKSSELFKYVRDCDIIVTNPPFSLFMRYFDFLWVSGKEFLILCDNLGVISSNVYPFIVNEKVSGILQKGVKFSNAEKNETICWLTNLPVKYPPFLNTGIRYSKANYKMFDNYPNILNIDAVSEIPMDYRGIMGVPFTFIFSWNPRQYELLDKSPLKNAYVDGKNKFNRILIRKKY